MVAAGSRSGPAPSAESGCEDIVCVGLSRWLCGHSWRVGASLDIQARVFFVKWPELVVYLYDARLFGITVFILCPQIGKVGINQVNRHSFAALGHTSLKTQLLS